MRRWEDNVTIYFKQTRFKIADWIHIAQDVGNTVIKFMFR